MKQDQQAFNVQLTSGLAGRSNKQNKKEGSPNDQMCPQLLR